MGRMGEDWTWRGLHGACSSTERGDDARTGDDDRGEETAGRLSQECTGFGVKESMLLLLGAASSGEVCMK